MRKVRYGKAPCRSCGDLITKNALGRAAHLRHCKGRPEPTLVLRPATLKTSSGKE